MKIKSAVYAFVVAFLLMSLPLVAPAQFGDPDPDPPITEPVPFDAGLTVVIGAGIAYAVKKRYDKKQVKK